MASRGVLFLGSLVILVQHGRAGVHTEAQTGPLYRVVGSPLSISCRTSGFVDDLAPKAFEFRVQKPDNPTFDLNIIKSSDPHFSYSPYMPRVKRREITLTHTTPNSVLFEIKSLQKQDEGEYECTVVNPEPLYAGTYSVKTSVKVIDDSLSVAAPATSLSYREGDALTLTCQASSNTAQHTHLSLTWFLHRASEESAQPIVTLDRDFTLQPGEGFQSRYKAGLIRLDKEGGASYSLGMARLQLSDQGRIFCQAREWIQDPDRSWYSIAEKVTEGSTVHVTARAAEADTPALVVRLTARQTAVQEGQPLTLSCGVDSQNLQQKLVAVAWIRDAAVLAEIGPTGILSISAESRSRERDGGLIASRVGLGVYQLVMTSARREDQGEYRCRAWLANTDLTPGAPQDSEPLRVTVDATESRLSVQLQAPTSVNEGDRLKLTCQVQGGSGQLAVTWKRQPPSSPVDDIISLSEEGVAEKAPSFEKRLVAAWRPASDVFVLELDAVTPADSGEYHCAVSERTTGERSSSQSQKAAVTVRSTDSLVRVSLKSRQTAVTVGDGVELMCIVTGPPLPLTVTWILQRDAAIDDILRLHSDGTVSWSAEQHRYQLKVQNQGARKIYYLLVNRASPGEAGSYQCQVSAFQDDVHRKLNTSNSVTVAVRNPESRLSVRSERELIVDVGSDVQLDCSVASVTSPSARHAVSWTLRRTSGNVSVVSWDRDAVSSEADGRISMRRAPGPRFQLTLRRVRSADAGRYRCEVAEWLPDPRGGWFRLAAASTVTNLSLSEPASLRLSPTQQQVNASAGEEVVLTCDLVSLASGTSLFYNVSWLYGGAHAAGAVLLAGLDHTGLLRYSSSSELHGLQGRLQLARPTEKTFSLRIQPVHGRDGGAFWCGVEQYQLDRDSGWQQTASATAGPIALSVSAAQAESGSNTGLWIGVLVGIIVLLLLVLALLLAKISRTKPEPKRNEDSLWVEELKLKE
ncbi:immunoglobulin superfamily member 2-like [Neosynchiropus ocellatus]